jgi:hypothetical protein
MTSCKQKVVLTVRYGMVCYGINMNIFKDNIINKCTSAYIVHHVLILQGTQLRKEAQINIAKNGNFLNILRRRKIVMFLLKTGLKFSRP